MMRLVSSCALASLAWASESDEASSMLQILSKQQRGLADEDVECKSGKCTTKATTEAPTAPPTTAAPTEPPPDDVDCEGDACDDNTIPDACSKGTVLTFNKKRLDYNNLGGMGPDFGKPKAIKWDSVAELDGKQINLVATANDMYRAKNEGYDWWGMTAAGFIKTYNGVHSQVGCIGSLARGTFDVVFKFQYADGSAAVIPILPLVFYDIDGGKELTATNDAETSIVAKNTALRKCTGKAMKGYTHCHEGHKKEVPTTGIDWENLTPAQKAASVTYVFKQKSEFTLRYSLGYEHRIFLFKGSKAMVCKKNDAQTTAYDSVAHGADR